MCKYNEGAIMNIQRHESNTNEVNVKVIQTKNEYR